MAAGDALARGFARGYTAAPPRLRALAMRGPQRRFLLAQIFRGMERQFDRAKGATSELVVHWEIGRPKGEPDRWQLAVAGGRCETGRKIDRAPDLTIKIEGDRFLELVLAPRTAPAMYMSGKLRIEGDPMRAATLGSLFRPVV